MVFPKKRGITGNEVLPNPGYVDFVYTELYLLLSTAAWRNMVTFNELRAIFDSDDLNPNSQIVFGQDENIIDDIGEDDDGKIIFYLKESNDS